MNTTGVIRASTCLLVPQSFVDLGRSGTFGCELIKMESLLLVLEMGSPSCSALGY